MLSLVSTDCGVGVKKNPKGKKKFEFFNLSQSSDEFHYNQRSMVERVNKYKFLVNFMIF